LNRREESKITEVTIAKQRLQNSYRRSKTTLNEINAFPPDLPLLADCILRGLEIRTHWIVDDTVQTELGYEGLAGPP
jgi:hypothetical protein